jgi:glycosyltransferase involved in cell wall biosynthesis
MLSAHTLNHQAGEVMTARPHKDRLCIALIGTRGVPAAYSGFETAVENLGSRLAARGHRVVVYCRPHMVQGRFGVYRGMRLVYLPTIASKHLDTFVHTFISTLHMGLIARPDVAVYFIAGNSPFAGLARLLGIPSAINVDGLDSRRAKWGGAARHYLRWAEHNAPRFADMVITDSRVLQQIYREEHRAETTFIPYGADMGDSAAGAPPVAETSHLERFGLAPQRYLLFVGRLVPENNAHVLIEAYAQLATDLPLVIVGDASYADDYIAGLHDRAGRITDGGKRVVFTGYLFGDAYRELARQCTVFAIPTEVGGTHPVLVEAMAAGACVVVNDHRPNMEVLGDAGVGYRGGNGAAALAKAIEQLLAAPAHAESLREKARERAKRLYSWDAVTDAYESLVASLARRRRSTSRNAAG